MSSISRSAISSSRGVTPTCFGSAGGSLKSLMSYTSTDLLGPGRGKETHRYHDDVYQQFASANHTAQPSTPSALALADNGSLSRDHRRSMSGLHCPSGFTRG